MILADGGYNDGFQFFETPTGENNDDQNMKSIARARHETINRRLKQWGILNRRFRHCHYKHGVAVKAIANITQMILECDWEFGYQFDDNEPIGAAFQVEYFDLD